MRDDGERGGGDGAGQRRHKTVGRQFSIRGVIAIAALTPFLFLQCTYFGDFEKRFEDARRLFHSGYLEASQHAAEVGYVRSQRTRPGIATQFLLLNAEILSWRGSHDDASRLLSKPLLVDELDAHIRQLTLEGIVEAHLREFDKAANSLTHADHLCLMRRVNACNETGRARAVLALQRGKFSEAHAMYQDSLRATQDQSDEWLEATLLLGLSATSLEEGLYDESMVWSKAALEASMKIGGQDLAQNALGNLGWAYFKLGDSDRALSLFNEAKSKAAELGDFDDEIRWLTAAGYVAMGKGDARSSRASYQRSLLLASEIHNQEGIADALTSLALVEVGSGDAQQAEFYANRALQMAQRSNSHPDMLDAIAVQMQAAALRGDEARSKELLATVESNPESQTALKWACEDAMARLYESQQQPVFAEAAYGSALSTFEAARAQLKHEDSQLPFVANATRIYDHYIHFLVTQGRVEDALVVADQSRARTLAQGLGSSGHERTSANALSPQMVARKAGATLLFYWLGEKQSYLWTVTPKQTALFPLPAQGKISPLVERYNRELLGASDPLDANGGAGQELYEMLVAPAAQVLASQMDGKTPVMVLTDGALSLLNFETLIVPAGTSASKSPSKSGNQFQDKPHYWIEDATVVSAPSLAMLATAGQTGRQASKLASKQISGDRRAGGKLLLLGDAVSPEPDYPELPYASLEMKEIEKHFAAGDESVFARHRATSEAYLHSNPRQYSYIHFVSHGVASRTDPLDSAIILSRSDSADANRGQGAFKLYAREIMQHSIDARVVTISACYSGGTRAFAGEGLVGLSWAFLRAGAHSTVGALWEVNDNSTARLMGSFYEGLEAGQSPATALRNAKLNLLHGKGNFRKPFYWAPFQLYTRM